MLRGFTNSYTEGLTAQIVLFDKFLLQVSLSWVYRDLNMYEREREKERASEKERVRKKEKDRERETAPKP